MKLLIRQRVLSWTDSYGIYGENGEVRYVVKAEFLALGHHLHVYDAYKNEIGVIRQKLFTLFPTFAIEIGGRAAGCITKQFSLLTPRYEIDFNGWRVKGDFLGWDYDVYSGGGSIIHISKELFHWGEHTKRYDTARLLKKYIPGAFCGMPVRAWNGGCFI